MTALLGFLIIGLLAVAGPLWCLAEFSRALKETPKIIGFLVRAGINPASMKQRKAVVIAFPWRSAPTQQASAARIRKYRSVNLLIVVWITILLASPAANRNLPAMASPTENWNLEIQKMMFVELFRNGSARILTPSSNLTLTHKATQALVAAGMCER